MLGNRKTGLERKTDSMVAQCETEVRGYLEQAILDTRLLTAYFLCGHEIKQRGLDVLVENFAEVTGLTN